jgi:hypothetical protein
MPATQLACAVSAQLPQVAAAVLLLLSAIPLCLSVPIPALEVSAPNTWGRAKFRKEWINPNTQKPVPCRQPAGRYNASVLPLAPPLLPPHTASRDQQQRLVARCNTFFNAPPAPTGRYGHTLLLRPADSSLYLFGGLDGRGRFLNDLWQFKLDPGQYECDWQELFTTQALAEQYASRDTSATTPKRRGQVPGQPSGRVGERHAASPPPPPMLLQQLFRAFFMPCFEQMKLDCLR